MDSNTLRASLYRVREWQESLVNHLRGARYNTRNFLRPLYIRNFAWIGSVEPCTGVLCETCQRCLRDLLILKVHHGTHHATASSMLAAVRIGCRICTCLWGQFTRTESVDPENAPREMNEPPGEFSRFWSPLYCPGFTKFKVWNSGWSNCPPWGLEPLAIRSETLPPIELFSYDYDRIDLMNHYWKLARGWLSECSSHHTRCKHTTSVKDYYPTRLIDVRKKTWGRELRLYTTSDGSIREPYMTLSHCWGNAQFLRLTSSTHDRLQQGFAFAELPPTFQDAIMVTRALGVNFLWIDALCIIQDSLVDWQHEATTMSQVYSSSMCNISALDAHDTTGGLFFDRETPNIPYCTFTACLKFKRKRVYGCAPADIWSDSVHHAPLTRRAWVLQERLLSPRVLHFGKKQLLWECNQLRACEFYPKGMPAMDCTLFDVSITDRFLKESVTTILHGVSNNALTSSQMHGAWNDIVQHYTKCNLTISKDKLVAISGVVKRLQPLFKSDYLAGLWRDNLLEQLLWHVVDSYDGAKRFLAEEERPKYRAPSWSWASIDVPIEHPRLYPRLNHMATIIEAHATPLTEDATGEVVDGYLRLRAFLFPVNVGTSKHSRFFNLVWAWGELEVPATTIPDVWPQPAVERLQYVPLLMTLYPPHIKSQLTRMYGLLLKPVDGKQGLYRRWGMTQLYGKQAGALLNFGVQLIKGQSYIDEIITLI